MNYERGREVRHATLTRQNTVPDVVSCMPAALVAQVAWPGLGKPGDRPPRAPYFFRLLGGNEGPPIFLNLAQFWLTLCCFFRQFAIFAYTLWAFWRLGPFSVRALKAWSPTSELISPGLGSAKFIHPPSSRRYIHSACKRSSYWRVASTPPPPPVPARIKLQGPWVPTTLKPMKIIDSVTLTLSSDFRKLHKWLFINYLFLIRCSF